MPKTVIRNGKKVTVSWAGHKIDPKNPSDLDDADAEYKRYKIKKWNQRPRRKGMTEQETEMNEDELNELGPKTLKSYADKTDASENKKRPMKRMYGNLQAKERLGGKFSIKNRKGKWQEKKYHAEENEMYEDQLDELSRKTLGDAWYKAKNDKKKDRSYVMKKTRERLDNTSDNYEKTKNIRKEEMYEDQLDELSDPLVKRYRRKAVTAAYKAREPLFDVAMSKATGGKWKTSPEERDNVKTSEKTLAKRRAGIKMADKQVPRKGGRPFMGEENEMYEDEMEPSVSDLVVHSIDQRPLDFQQSFADLMQARISDAVYEKKLDIAAGFTGANTDPSDDDYEDDGDWDEGDEVESDDEDV
jgi:hypothetical protein